LRFDVAAQIKKREDQLRRNTLSLCSRVAEFIKVDGGFLVLLQVVTIICHSDVKIKIKLKLNNNK
jgi:hypothetical protein